MQEPTRDLYDGIALAFPLEVTPWDDYFARMAEADFLLGRHETLAAKSYFVRKAPFNGSFTLLGGITAALRVISEIRFDTPEFARAMERKHYRPEFIAYLATLDGLKDVKVHAAPEGTPFFPNEPIISITGPIAQLRLADGILIGECNFPSLSLTKWSRIVRTTRPGGVLEFARRRSQDRMRTSLYAMLAGCVATSNDELTNSFDVEARGTMGHEWVQSFPTVREAFDAWLSVEPRYPVGLVDTVKCLEEDFPAWLDSVEAHKEAIREANPAVWGWRNDSGDLAYLTIEQYARFMRHPLASELWFRDHMRIYLTNELDEYAAGAIIAQITTQARAAGLDAEDILHRIVWAAGTRPGVCEDDPALGGVMKLVEFDGRPCIKLALDADGRVGVKTSIPGFNLSAMIRSKSGENLGIVLYPAHRYEITDEGQFFDLVKNHVMPVIEVVHPDNESLASTYEEYTVVPRQALVYDGGLTDTWQRSRPTIESVQAHVRQSVDDLQWWVTRIDQPHNFKVSVTPDVFRLRTDMIRKHALQGEYASF